MKTFDEYLEMTAEELIQEFHNSRAEIKQDHDMAVLMGSVGVSPKYMNMYFNSIKKIREVK